MRKTLQLSLIPVQNYIYYYRIYLNFIRNEAGSNPIAGFVTDKLAERGGLNLPDKDDEVRVNFDLQEAGDYLLKVRVRSGNTTNETNFLGSYDFDLKKSGDQWKITSMKFNYKYQEGNTSLPEKAIKNAKE